MLRTRLLIGLAFLTVLASSPAAATGPGEMCDAIAGIACDEGLWCEHPDGQCKVADAAGKCVKAAEVCTQDYDPVCGCDGETYGNRCMAKVAKVQVDSPGECKE